MALEKSNILPEHIAIIMDGNGRWANAQGLPRYKGHAKGAHTVEAVLDATVKHQIKYLTLFAFSSENVNRSKTEINFLKTLFYNNISTRLEELNANNIKLKFIGSLDFFGEKLVKKMVEAEELTKNNTALNLTIALNYGGRWDIVTACNKILKDNLQGKITSNITEEIFNQYISTYNIPDPDLLIRTSGEKRISNFLLWQLAYSEIYFSDKYWPDFTAEDFELGLKFFATRQRRFGKAESLI